MCIWVPKSHLPKTKAECQKISSFPQREGFPEENNGRIRSLATNEGLEAPGGSRQSPRPLGHPRPPPLSQSSGHRGRHRPSSTSCHPAPIVPVPTQSAWACNVEERQKELTGRHPAQPAPWAPPPALLSPSCPPVFLVSRVPAAMASERSSGHRLRVFCDPAGSATGLCTRGWGGGATRSAGRQTALGTARDAPGRRDSHTAVGEGQAVRVAGQALLFTVVGAGGRGESVAGADVVRVDRLPPGPTPVDREQTSAAENTTWCSPISRESPRRPVPEPHAQALPKTQHRGLGSPSCLWPLLLPHQPLQPRASSRSFLRAYTRTQASTQAAI